MFLTLPIIASVCDKELCRMAFDLVTHATASLQYELARYLASNAYDFEDVEQFHSSHMVSRCLLPLN